MTQPNTVDMSFDTSLIDVKPANTSFSTTESDPSSENDAFKRSSSTIPNTPVPQSASTAMPPPAPVQHIPTHLAYDQWASVYDTDGNMLQAIDDLCLSTLLPSFLSTLSASKEISILDLGCGTGRNTSKLLSFAYPASTSVRITGVDFSAGMLNIARSKLTPLVSSSSTLSLRLECRDPFSSSSSSLPQQHAIISTLVLEHIPLATFFSTLSALLVPNGQALVTNMHADMGRSSQAGFVNADGIKVRGSSFVHTVEETIEAAQEAGLELVDVRERAMQRDDVEGGAVSERGRKWIGTKVWYAVVLSKIG